MKLYTECHWEGWDRIVDIYPYRGGSLPDRNKLNGLFVKHASMTCMAYLLNLRIDLAKILLTKTELPVNEISARVGYPDANYFAKLFRQETGMTPSQYRKS